MDTLSVCFSICYEFRILFVIGFFPYDKESYFTIVRETAPWGANFLGLGQFYFIWEGGGGEISCYTSRNCFIKLWIYKEKQ